jgi:hypothetical protein
MNNTEVAQWQEALAGQKRWRTVSHEKREVKKPCTGEKPRTIPTVVPVERAIIAPDQIMLTQDMYVDRVNTTPKNALYVRVRFEHSQGKEAAHALVDSSVTKNFVDLRMAE